MKALTIILTVLAVLMVIIGVVDYIIPPIITGVGFLVIALMFNTHKDK